MNSRSATVTEEFFVSQKLNAKYQLSIFTYLLLVIIELVEVARLVEVVEVVEVVALSTLKYTAIILISRDLKRSQTSHTTGFWTVSFFNSANIRARVVKRG